jgi:hypothetical protein
MFPTQVSDWQTESRVGSPPIGKGSSFDVTDNPIELQLKQLSAVRDAYPAPVSVTFALRRKGGTWQRLAIDDSAPYRAFVDPGLYPKHERIDAVAVAHALDGRVSVSPVTTFAANG